MHLLVQDEFITFVNVVSRYSFSFFSIRLSVICWSKLRIAKDICSPFTDAQNGR
jgi:hypothetical protein